MSNSIWQTNLREIKNITLANVIEECENLIGIAIAAVFVSGVFYLSYKLIFWVIENYQSWLSWDNIFTKENLFFALILFAIFSIGSEVQKMRQEIEEMKEHINDNSSDSFLEY